MKRKKILKFIANLFDKPVTKVLLYIAGILFVLDLSLDLSDGEAVVKTFLEIIKSNDMLTLFIAGLLSLGFVKLINWCDDYLEESKKIEDDHHKIIAQYKEHRFGLTEYDKSFADKKGVFLTIHQLRDHFKKPKKPDENATIEQQKQYKKDLRRWEREIAARNPVKDDQSDEYVRHSKIAEKYLSGGLCLSSTNVFANVAGDTSIKFKDTYEKHELPAFVITHADEILQAHKNSAKNNSRTIRLDDFDYDASNKTLTLKTSRSTYYHMLITNRCMDYKFANGLSVRELYEYEKEICSLERSKLGNQIGINGLIVTNDGYVLIEKRGRKKITWKNKFAQSISLAMKLKDLGIGVKDTLDENCAQEKLKYIIEKTINENFGLVSTDYADFKIEENFLGLARDLLEGGKPNLYFYVQTNCSAKKLKEIIEANTKVVRADNIGKNEDEKKKVIATSKLDSDYYLVKFSDIEIDYNYRMFLDRKNAYKVNRKLHPRTSIWAELWDKFKNKVSCIIDPVLVRECGEALLVTIAYMELRDKWIKREESNE